MQVEGGATDGEGVSVTFQTADGGSCSYTGEVKIPCDTDAVIQYTTLQMSVDEEQSLSASIPGQAYTWGLSGGGSLSTNEGDSTTYTAPSTNPNCDENATITLSCDGMAIDSITIAINEWPGGDKAYRYYGLCEYYAAVSLWVVWYDDCDCNDVLMTHHFVCGTGTEASCQTTCLQDTLMDTRTEAMLAGGCCPEGLL